MVGLSQSGVCLCGEAQAPPGAAGFLGAWVGMCEAGHRCCQPPVSQSAECESGGPLPGSQLHAAYGEAEHLEESASQSLLGLAASGSARTGLVAGKPIL